MFKPHVRSLIYSHEYFYPYPIPFEKRSSFTFEGNKTFKLDNKLPNLLNSVLQVILEFRVNNMTLSNLKPQFICIDDFGCEGRTQVNVV